MLSKYQTLWPVPRGKSWPKTSLYFRPGHYLAKWGTWMTDLHFLWPDSSVTSICVWSWSCTCSVWVLEDFMWDQENSVVLFSISFNGYQNICPTLAKHLIDGRKINLAVIYILKSLLSHSTFSSPRIIKPPRLLPSVMKLWSTPIFKCQMLLKDR